MPAGAIFEDGQVVLAKTTHTFDSIDDLKGLALGMSPEASPIFLGDVADVNLGTAAPKSISRTNGKPSVSISIIKGADANTIDVTTAVREAVEGLTELPAGRGDRHHIRSGAGDPTPDRHPRPGSDVRIFVRGYRCLRVHADVSADDSTRTVQHRSPDYRCSTVYTSQCLHRRVADRMAGHVAELHDVGRPCDLRWAGCR